MKRLGRMWARIAAVLAIGGAASMASVLVTTAEPSGAATSGAPIKIGLVCSCTGPLASAVVDIPAVYRAWVDTVNASGGINGHQLQLVYENDQSNPGTSVSEVQTLVQSDHVVAIADASNNDAGWASYVQQQHVPVVGITTSTEPFYLNSDFYPEGQTEDSLFYGIVDAVKKAGTNKMSLFYCAEAVQCQEGIAPLKAQAKAEKVQVVSTLEISASAPSYAAQCVAAKQSGAVALYLADAQQVNEKVAANCTTQGYNAKYIIDGEDITTNLPPAPGIKTGTWLTVPNLPYFVNTSAVKTMNSALDKYASGVRSHDTYGELPMEAWISGKLFQAAAQAGHLGANGSTPTSAQLVAGLDSLHGTTLDGLAPPLNFTAGKPHPVDCWYYTVIKDGKYSTPYGLTPSCASSSSSSS